MKKLLVISMGLLMAAHVTGCALMNQNGSEVYASLGYRAVHEHQSSQRTYAEPPCGGIKSWFNGCAARQAQATVAVPQEGDQAS